MLKVDIDKFIRSALNRNKPAYDESIWQGIEERLDIAQKPKPGFTGVWFYIVAFVALFMAGGAGYFLGIRNSDKAIISANITGGNAAVVLSADQIPGQAPNDAEGFADKSQIVSPQSNMADQNDVVQNQVATSLKNSYNVNGHTAVRKPSALNLKTLLSPEVNLSGEDKKLELQKIPAIYANMGKISAEEIILNNSALSTKLPSISPSFISATKPDNSLQGIAFNIWDNPAYAGAGSKFNFSSKADFLSFEKRYRPSTNYYTSFDCRIDKINSGIGIYALRSVIPTMGINTLGAAYSYRFPVSNTAAISFGLGGNLSNTRNYILDHYDAAGSKTSFIFAPRGDALSISSSVLSTSAGLWYEDPHFIAGASLKNFNRPANPEGAPVPMLHLYTIGYKTLASKNLHILSLVEIQSGLNNAWSEKASILANYKGILTGLSWQNEVPGSYIGDLSLYLGVDIRSHIRIFSSYGYGTSQVAPASNYRILQGGIGYRFH